MTKERKERCIWERKIISFGYGYIMEKPGCRKSYSYNSQKSWQFCPYCGKKIEVSK